MAAHIAPPPPARNSRQPVSSCQPPTSAIVSYDLTASGFGGTATGAAADAALGAVVDAAIGVVEGAATGVVEGAPVAWDGGVSGSGSTVAYVGIGAAPFPPPVDDRPSSHAGTWVSGTPCARARPSTSR
ncbi:hypothetical protein EF907_05680 [Streptomyces sp. WAC06273]|nr:hypothetical protein EF907_05680 [Streptomyces sp. WAC06273]